MSNVPCGQKEKISWFFALKVIAFSIKNEKSLLFCLKGVLQRINRKSAFTFEQKRRTNVLFYPANPTITLSSIKSLTKNILCYLDKVFCSL